MHLPSAIPPGVLSAQMENPREYDPRSVRDLGAASTLWSPVQYTFPGTVIVYPETQAKISPWIEASGTVFQILGLDGANAIGVRFDTNGSFIKMQEGDAYEGSFSRVQFKPLQYVGLQATAFHTGPMPDVRIDAIASQGGRVTKAPRREGMVDGFPIWTGTATTGGNNIMDAFPLATYTVGVSAVNYPTPGASGGQIVIKNTGSVTLYLFNCNPRSGTLFYGTSTTFRPNVSTAWPLEPGESVTIPAKSRLQSLAAATLSGTCTFAVMADAPGDGSLTNQVPLG